jgi:hypothetical protein
MVQIAEPGPPCASVLKFLSAVWLLVCSGCDRRWSAFSRLEIVNNPSYITTGFRVGRHVMILLHPFGSSVVKIIVIEGQQFTQIARATPHIDGRVHRVLHAELGIQDCENNSVVAV